MELGQYLTSYVKYEDKWFFVSSINRMCSSDYPIMFSETMVWEWDKEKNERLNSILGEFSSFTNSSVQHFRVVDNLLTNGNCEIEEEEEVS